MSRPLKSLQRAIRTRVEASLEPCLSSSGPVRRPRPLTKTPHVLLLSLLALLASCIEADRRNAPLPKLDTSAGIDPDKEIYGIPIGTPKDIFVRVCGEPTGHVRLAGSGFVLLYGSTHAFLFEDDRLMGIQLGERQLTGHFASLVASNRFDGVAWRLSNGITNRMTLTDVKRIAGGKLLQTSLVPETRGFQHYRVGNSRVDIEFVHRIDLDGDDAYEVHTVHIRR